MILKTSRRDVVMKKDQLIRTSVGRVSGAGGGLLGRASGGLLWWHCELYWVKLG